MRRLLVSAFVIAALVACGSSGSSADGPHILTSHADLCAGSPPDYGDHVVTMVSCPFIQHADNISKFGQSVATSGLLRDGTGAHVATITDTCETWAVGKDDDGVVVIVKTDTGEVIAHGNLHAGQELSKLPPKLALPLTVE